MVDALLDYVYGGEPEITTTGDAMELLVVANAYDLHFLVEAIESDLLQDLDSQTALEVFHQAHMLGFDRVCSACEELIVSTFQECMRQEAFLKLTPVQLGSILKRPDLHVAREEAVLQALLTWYKADKSRRAYLGLLLQDVDYPALSAQNLERLSCFAESLGPDGQDLSRSVKKALQWHRKRDSSPGRVFEAKRRRLLQWLPHFGADVKGLRAQDGEVVATFTSEVYHFCIRKGTGYAFLESKRQIVSWTPGNNQNRVVAGAGAAVNGVNDINKCAGLDVSPEGELVVADWTADGDRLLGFRNGMGTLKQSLETRSEGLCFSPAGVLYVLDRGGKRVQKLLPDSRFISVIESDQLASDMRFCADSFTVPDEDTVYITDNFRGRARILALEARSGLKVVETARGKLACVCFWGCVKEGRIFAVDQSGVIQMYMPGCKNPVHILSVSDLSDPDDNPAELWADLRIDEDWLYVLTTNPMGRGNVKAKVQRYPLEPWPLIMERQELPRKSEGENAWSIDS